MKMFVAIAALTFSTGAAYASSNQGNTLVEQSASGAILIISGDAATALYEGMTQVAPSQFSEGEKQGQLKTGENYACARITSSAPSETTCVMHVSRPQIGLIAKAND